MIIEGGITFIIVVTTMEGISRYTRCKGPKITTGSRYLVLIKMEIIQIIKAG